jgi:phosphatidylethanolamine/phosphatidyl-N-methylethanolamine N-methyltransferase
MGMEEHSTRKIYNLQAHFYDEIAGGLIRRRQKDAIGRMQLKPGDRILDIRIGTGVSLETYPPECRVVGIDISEGMLQKAQDRINERNLSKASLAIADAMFMPFKENTFDHILVSHVVTVVSDPVCLLNHIKRVGKPGCRIVIINHFQSGFRLMAWFEKVFSPFFTKLGWRSDLNLHELLQEVDMEIDFRYKVRYIDLWDIVFLRNNKPRLGRFNVTVPSDSTANRGPFQRVPVTVSAGR